MSMIKEQQKFFACMNRLKHQISSLSVSSSHDPSEAVSSLQSILKISNQDIKYQLQHGKAFKDLLEPRDQVLEHQFCFQEEFSIKQYSTDEVTFSESKLYESIMEKIQFYLAESISNIVSIAFKFLCKGQLEGNQAKQYASKNIMLNVHSIFRQTILSIQNNNVLRNIVNLENVQANMIIQIDNIVQNILINLADSYPQAPPAGGTPRMRQVLTEVNRVDDDENDFIFTSGIKISDFMTLKKEKNEKDEETVKFQLPQSEDYTSFIMRVINEVILVSERNQELDQDRTIFQSFTEFNEHLFWLVEQKSYQKIMNTLEEEDTIQLTDVPEYKELADEVCTFYDHVFKGDDKDDSSLKTAQLDKLREQIDDGIQNMAKHKKYAMGQKVPVSVKPFSEQEIINKQFSARHSAILRILTKWAECLEDIFENPEKVVTQRLYPFRDIHNKPFNLRKNQKDGEEKLIRQLEEQYKVIRTKFNLVLKNSYGYIGKLLSSPQSSIVSNVNRYTETRTVSSKINAVLTSLMLSYTNLLIHHLLKAGQQILTKTGYQDINLIVFRVMDILRSKFMCSQRGFISILRTMYLLDSRDDMQTKFKIIKIRDKLDDPANNIMVNYLFMGKVQCELQLSIQQSKGKEKNYYTFSHFVYELTRGKFGALAECAIMISQLDPMITACKNGYYSEKQKKSRLLIQQEELKLSHSGGSGLFDSTNLHSSSKASKIETSFFECSVCTQLITNQKLDRILEKPESNLCYNCLIKKKHPEEFLKEEFKEIFSKLSQHRLRNYRGLKYVREVSYIVQIGSLGELSLKVVTFSPAQFKTFTIKIDSKMIDNFNADGLNFDDIDYVDLSDQIKTSYKNAKPPKILCYLFNHIDSIPQTILTKLSITKEELLGPKLADFIRQFSQFRQEKNVIKTIKDKNEIIRANEREGQVLDKVCRVLVLGEGKQIHHKVFSEFFGSGEKSFREMLKYNGEKSLDLSYIEKITSESVGFEEIPRWIIRCNFLKYLGLNKNKIKVVKKGQLPASLTQLSLKKNGLEEIDLSELTVINNLCLKDNQLTTVDLSQNNRLNQLSIRGNLITKFDYLPPSLEKLWADRDPLVNYDYQELQKLKILMITSEETKEEQLTNLGKKVKIEMMGNKKTKK